MIVSYGQANLHRAISAHTLPPAILHQSAIVIDVSWDEVIDVEGNLHYTLWGSVVPCRSSFVSV